MLGEHQRGAASNAGATAGDDGDPPVEGEPVHVKAPPASMAPESTACTTVQHMLYLVTCAAEERSLSDLYYDPWDVEIDIDPYPTYRRLRDESRSTTTIATGSGV